MKQQINLYQPMFRKQEIIFSAVAMIQITCFFIVVLVAIYFYNVSKLDPFREELGKTTAQFEKLTNQIQVMAQKFPQQSGSKLLENEISTLTRELEQRNRVKEELVRGSFGNTEGFSGYLEALAGSHVNGAWLTGINISRGGRQLTINGKSISPELVPVYIKRLAEAPAFDNKKFNIVELQRSAEVPDQITFNVGTGG